MNDGASVAARAGTSTAGLGFALSAGLKTEGNGGILPWPRLTPPIQPPVQSTAGAPLWPLAVYFAAVAILAAIMLVLSYVLGERHRERATGQAYESGMLPTGSARVRLSVKFYLIAMFFVIFDLESVFIFAWAVAFRELGWIGYAEVLFFIGVLLAALIYLWRIGALDWGTTRRKAMTSEKE
jgi:NADH-quinone oxidoreductase subunit A